MMGVDSFAHDIAVANADGVTIYYTYINNSTELQVSYRGSSYSYYSNEYTGNVNIPETVTYNNTTYSVTSIDYRAFYQCSGLTSVTIGNSVTSIGGYAFSYCSGLTSVTIPNSVTSIGDYAFYQCSGLTSVTIPNSVTSIGYEAFRGCSGLTEVNFNATNCTSMGDSSNPVFKNCTSLSTLNIGDNVQNIPSYAFYECSSLKSVNIGNSVTSIRERAFDGCSGLTSITIPSSMTSIGIYAFCDCSGLREVNFNATNCTSMGSYTCPVFSGCSSLTTLNIGDNVENIPNSAFMWCFSLTSVTIGNSVTSIGSSAFESCKSLTSVTIPNSVTSIGEDAFRYCSGLKTVTIGNSVTSIGETAFSGCSSLTSVTIPNSVTSIGESAFSSCSSLTSVTIPNSVTCIENSVFSGSGLTSVIIPNSVTSIGQYAFRGCSSLESVIIGTGVLSIGSLVFDNHRPAKVIWLTNTPPSGYSYAAGTVNYVANNLYTSLSNKTVYNLLSSMFEVDGVKYVPVSMADRTCDAIDCLYNDEAENVHIGETVTYRNNMGDLTFTVNQVHPYACYNNKSIKDIQLSFEGNVGSYAFYNCTGATAASVANKGDVGEYAFSKCTSLSTVTASNEGTIGNYAFAKCTASMTATLTNKGNLGNNVFYNCTGLTSAEIANTGAIGNYGFYGCSSLQTATLGEKVTGIGQYAFSGCSTLGSIVIPNSVTSMGQYAFQDCSSMASVNMGNGVSTIETYTFSGCSKLTDMQIGTKVGTINTYAFYNCSLLPRITIPLSVTTINNYVFKGCTALKDVNIADRNTILTLGSNGSSPLFADCPLETVYIGGNISYSTSNSYGNSPFYRNTSLKSVTITDEETEISVNEFYGCTNLQQISIGDGVTTIGNWAFSGCSSLDYFAFGSSVASIGQEAFSDCTAMTRLITHAETPPTCGSQALDDINKLQCSLEVPTGRRAVYATADQWKQFAYVSEGNGTNQSYRITYKVDGETYKIATWYYGAAITPEPEPTKDGYTFSGWSEIPATMPAENITVTGTFTPDQQNSVTVTARSYTVQYGDAIPALGYTSTGAALNGTPQLTCEAVQGSPVGTYTITASRGTVTNQNDSYVNGTLTITRAPLTISAGTYTRAQGEENPTFTLSYDGLKMGETAATALTHQATATTLATTTSEPGQYRVTVSGAESDNYDIVYVNGTLNVTAAPETVDTENMLIINNLETSKGKTVALPVSMTNTKQIAGFQFDLILPAGVSVATNSNGKYVTTLSTRAGDHTVSATSLGNNTYRFVVTSMGGDVFAMGEGTVITVMLKVESTVADGNYTMKVKSELTGKEGSTMTRIIAADSQATLTVTSVKPGDANGDGFVTVTDVICIISEVLNETPDGFIRTAADVNGDGVVTVTDAIIVIDMVLNNGKTSNARRMMRQVPDPQ